MTEGDAAPAPGAPEDRALCPHCGEEVPPGTFCGHCGAHLDATSARRRTWAYAAAPHQHVLGLDVVSTLFPHLPHHHAHAFRRVLAGGVGVLLLLAALRLQTPATVAAAVVLPIIYVLYLYEVEVYETEPLQVIGLTFVLGAGLGVAESLLVARRVGADILTETTGHRLVVDGILVPLLVQALMVVGPLLLLLMRRRFDHALDGLAFGVTAALGFSLAAMLSDYWPIITGRLVSDQPTVDWASRLFRSGILVFVVNAGATAIITTAIWLRVHGRARGLHAAAWRSVAVAVASAVAVQVGLGIAGVLVDDLFLLVVVSALAAGLMLVHLRVVIHHALLEEGGPLHVGDPSVCDECHHLVPTMIFCPHCGVARSASSKAHPAAAGGSDLAEAAAS